MRVGSALAAGVLAPIRRWRLVLVLWLARLVPVVLVFGLPAYRLVRERSARHPDAGVLIDSSKDGAGFAWAWHADLFRDAFSGAADTIFWLVILCWMLVTTLAGGITARLVHGGGGLFLAECGRYAGRFLRLGFVSLFALYALDVAINTFLQRSHADGELLHHTQEVSLNNLWTRGLLFVTLAYLVGLVHAYARIEIVAHERRSALISFLRGIGSLLGRLPWLVLLESGMLLAAGGAALVAWLLTRVAAPVPTGATPLAVFLVLAALASYLRTGIEVGAMDARCRLLVRASPPPAPPGAPEPSRLEPLPPLDDRGPGDLFLPPDQAS